MPPLVAWVLMHSSEIEIVGALVDVLQPLRNTLSVPAQSEGSRNWSVTI